MPRRGGRRKITQHPRRKTMNLALRAQMHTRLLLRVEYLEFGLRLTKKAADVSARLADLVKDLGDTENVQKGCALRETARVESDSSLQQFADLFESMRTEANAMRDKANDMLDPMLRGLAIEADNIRRLTRAFENYEAGLDEEPKKPATAGS